MVKTIANIHCTYLPVEGRPG